METKTFGDKKITIKKFSKSDIKNARQFMLYFNSLIDEEVKLNANKKLNLKEEKEILEDNLKKINNKTALYLVALHNGKVVGMSNIELKRGRQNHIGGFGISIGNSYRGIGLGKYLASKIIDLSKTELVPAPKIIQLEVYTNNEPAINLYKKMGFKIAAKIPKQNFWKGRMVDDFLMQLYLK